MLLPAHPHPLPPAAFFAAVIRDLCTKIALHGPRTPALAPLVQFLWNYLQRKVRRLERLHALFQAGRLPNPRPARPQRPRPQPQSPPRLRLPSRRAWLIRLVQPMAVYGTQLEVLLTHPDIQALIAATPQAGRILRPIFRMLGIHPMPPLLRLPVRPRPPKPVMAGLSPKPASARQRRTWRSSSPGRIGATHHAARPARKSMPT